VAYEYFIGSRYLRASRKEAFISLIALISVGGVTVGVMALIVVIAVMTGFEKDLKARILGITSHVVVMRHGQGISDYRSILAKVETVQDVEGAAPFIQLQAMLRSSQGTSGALVKGIDPGLSQAVLNLGQHISHGSLDALDRSSSGASAVPGIVLGRELALNLGVGLGDGLYVLSPQGTLSPVGHIPTMLRFEVVGIFKSGMYDYDASLAYVRLNDAQRLQRTGDVVTGIELRVADVYRAQRVSDNISKLLGFPYWTRSWMQMNQNLFAALKLEKVTMFVILTLIVLVAAFNIASTLIMMVMEKKKDIAILKAMGTTSHSIRKIFVFNGMVIGGIGTVLGVSLGFVLCEVLAQYPFIRLPSDVYYISTLPVRMELWDVGAIAGAALGISFMATLYPAWQAARMDPVEALRYG